MSEQLPPPLNLNDLRNQHGFSLVGQWILNVETGAIDLNTPVRHWHLPGVYLFAVADEVLYVGKAGGKVRQRLRPYRTPLKGTDRIIHHILKERLELKQQVDVWVVQFQERYTEWNGLPLDKVSGIEGGLIASLRPPYNIIR